MGRAGQAAAAAARELWRAATQDEDGAVAVYAALGLLGACHTAARAGTIATVRQVLPALAAADGGHDGDDDGDAAQGQEEGDEDIVSYSEVVAAELRKQAAADDGGAGDDEIVSYSEVVAAELRGGSAAQRPELASHFLEAAAAAVSGGGEGGAGAARIPFATKY